jgi:predicted phage terminase large subunit-like protein
MTVWGVFNNDQDVPQIMLMNGWQARMELNELVERIASTAKKFKVDHLIVENKASGISVAQEIRRLYAYEDFSVQLIDPKGGDKVARAYSVQHILAEGIVHAPMAFSWADMVVTQCSQFPKGKHDDIVDTVTMALRYLRNAGMITRGSERTAETAAAVQFHGNAGDKPLYPV